MKNNKNYEVPFKAAKKDKDGYAALLVRFGDEYVPVKGRPLPLSKAIITNIGLDEIKRLNLTHWELKDIPEVAKVLGKICGNKLDTMLYWNGYKSAWEFDDELDHTLYKDCDYLYMVPQELLAKVDKFASECYAPYEDSTGNYGDASVHCVYSTL